ncbi:hypothetical protein PV327_008904 [Microctonus hyperodae]|uniref:UDP-glucuronosyltransferase n=1 Tax=Microctonus hyperodae TaxID=165561 RepID=A0AA39FSN9_MICHY|nr:hypothetical protein PV327_008904 [Microctonus hyperodae]
MKLSIQSLVILIIFLGFHFHNCEALKILGIFPLPGRSHFIPNGQLMRSLASRGHQVDVVSNFPLKNKIPNYTDISLAGLSPQITNNVSYEETKTFTKLSMQHFVYKTGITVCDLLSADVFGKLLKTPKNTYDVIVVELFTSNCFLAFGKHLNAPIVGTVLSKMHDWLYSPFGVPFNTAYMPSLFSSFSQSMTFLERLQNTFIGTIVTPQINYYLEIESEYVEKYFQRKLSTISELYNDVAIVLVNSHHSLNEIIPTPPGVIEVGGLHVHDDQQILSTDVQKWLDDSKNGCVYFSFGSMVRIETYPAKTLKIFYEMFEKIAPIRVLLKIADPTILPMGLPNNVMTSDWLPQIAVLKHPNVKLFITHGGLIGTQEAVVHGVPMIGFPIFGDQYTNIQTYVNKKIAIALNHREITGDILTDAVKTVLYDPTYRKNIKTLSALFNDRPMAAMDTAIYWVEYAARRGNILKSPATNLTWWQYYLIDVYATILFVILFVLFVVKLILKFLFKIVCSRKSNEAKMSIEKNKKNK